MAQQNFQSLLPKDDVDLHSYQDALDYAMEHEEIRNVALSGSYGSGKRSVINSCSTKSIQKTSNNRSFALK